MLKTGISHTAGRPDVDFGLGFYMTTLLRQAEDWAYLKHKGHSLFNRGLLDYQSVVLWMSVPRSELSKLDSMCFARGDYHAEGFWSFVQHCRSSTRATVSKAAIVHHHARDNSSNATWYDLVCGPVAAFWQQRSAMLDTDQYSFHSQRAVDVLNDIIRRGGGVDYDVSSVVV